MRKPEFEIVKEPRTDAVLHHTVSKADTLQGIAVRYGVTPSAILAHNKTHSAQALFVRGTFAIPSPPRSQEAPSAGVLGARWQRPEEWVTFGGDGGMGHLDEPRRLSSPAEPWGRLGRVDPFDEDEML